MLRHGDLRDILHWARTKPREMLNFPRTFYFSNSRMVNFVREQETHEWVQMQGFMPSERGQPLPRSCSIPDGKIAVANTTSVRQLVQSFTSDNTKTMVFFGTPYPIVNTRLP